jgi:predicted phosphodiesterase
MRVALISDIHGNEIALRAVLRSIERHGVDQIVCLGDVATLGVAPGEVVDTLERLGCRCIMGNHDEYLFDEDLTRAYTRSNLILEAIDWCRHQLPREQVEFARHFETGFELPLGNDHRLKVFHGSPSSNVVDLLADTPGDVFDSQLGPLRATIMAGGHTHLQMVRQHQGVLVVNPGSVGAPFKEFPNGGPPRIMSHAEYATIDGDGAEVSVTLHRVDLDRHELARAALASSNPMSRELAGPYL